MRRTSSLSLLARIRTAIDILRNRLPGALAMFKAGDISISVHSGESRGNRCQVIFWFDDSQSCGNAYRAIERIYQMNRVQCDLDAWPMVDKVREQDKGRGA
jgi:hypothetical protein